MRASTAASRGAPSVHAAVEGEGEGMGARGGAPGPDHGQTRDDQRSGPGRRQGTTAVGVETATAATADAVWRR